MKKYLSNTMLALLISVTICFNSYGQTKQDTVKCIMLVCDTSHVIGRYYKIDSLPSPTDSSLFHFTEVAEDYGFHDNKILYWQIGYEVVVKTFDQVPDDAASVHHNTDGSWTDDAVIHWRITEQNEHIEYLDADKKPLNTNIIVWQSKSL